MPTNLCQSTEAVLNLPALTDRAAVLNALSQLLQAVALNQIDTRRANLLLRGLSLAARLTAALEKQESSTQESNQAGAPGLASETWVLNPAPISHESDPISVIASTEGDEPQPIQETPSQQAASIAEITIPAPDTIPPPRLFLTDHQFGGHHLSLREKIAARRGRVG